MVSIKMKVIELNYIKLDFFEKELDSITVHLYVKDLKYCRVQFETRQFNVMFRTSNEAFLKTHSGDVLDLFSYLIKTRFEETLRFKVFQILKLTMSLEDIEHADCTYEIKKYYMELNIKKKEPSKWGCLKEKHSEEKNLYKNGLHHSTSSKFNIHYPTNQLLGGKSTPLTKKTSEESSQDVEASLPNAISISSSNVRNVSKINIVSDPMLGLTGLENYANNCYMNVVLQLLANIYEIREYFKNDVFLKDIAVNNPLSSGGKVAKTFAEVVKALWLPSRNAFRPLALKNVMGKQCASFLGLQQHDAQEFFSSLLDNLHEDLNQQCVSKEDCELNVNEKPDTAWNAHVKRNNSLIVKLFHGQLKSKVTCTACHRVSYSYDPCAQISLPIPSVKQCIWVLFFPSRIDAVPLMIPLQVSTPNATIWHLLNMLQSCIKVLPHQIRLFSGLTDICNDLKIPLASQFKYKYAIACEVKEENISLPVFQYLLNANSFVYCDFCYKSEKHLLTKLKRCTKCFAVSYCSRDCQIKHWQTHKLSCSKDLKMQVGIPFYINITRNDLTFEYLESALKLRASVSVQFSNLSDTNMTPSNMENIPKCNILIKVSNKMNVNDDSTSLVTKDNFSETIIKGVCLIIEWQNCPEERVLTKEEPVCDYYKSLFKETPHDEEHCTLSDCLRLFMEPEKLDGNESWKCPKCKTFQTAKKEMTISLPSCLLLLHLKRFSYGEYGEKITKTVSYPLSNFDLAPFVCKESLDRIDYPLIYDLCGVISHLGTMRMGHYTCMTKMFNQRDQEEGGWRLFDDETATKIKPDKVVSANAYVLVYRLRGTSDILKLDRYPVNTSSINGFFSENNQLTKKKSESASLKENSVEMFTNKYKRSISLEFAEDKKKIAELSPESRRCLTFFDKGNKARRSAKHFSSSSEELLSLSNIEKMSFESKDDFGQDLLNFKNHTDSGFSHKTGEENNSHFHNTVDVLTCDLSCTSLIDVHQDCSLDVNNQISVLSLKTVQIENDDKVFQDLINMDEDELD